LQAKGKLMVLSCTLKSLKSKSNKVDLKKSKIAACKKFIKYYNNTQIDFNLAYINYYVLGGLYEESF